MAARSNCPVCCHDGMSVFLEIRQVPVHCNLLWPSREAALNAPRDDIRLGFCRACGMIYNLAFDSSRMAYSEAYGNSLHFSPHFQSYARGLAAQLIEKYELYGKNIIELGCGKGEFLAMLCEGGGNRGTGFDPSYDGGNERKTLTFVRDFYSAAYADYQADFICCRQVLEHIEDPRKFLHQLRHIIGDRYGAIVFFEVPNAFYTLKDLGIWDIIYEHCSYFSVPSLRQIFQKTDFAVLRVYREFGGQYLCLEASADLPPSQGRGNARGELEEISALASAFGDTYRSKLKAWESNLTEHSSRGKRMVVWGAGSKGITFLNTVKAASVIEYVVDINPRKQGLHVPGTGQCIVPPDFLRAYRPEAVVVTNPIYKEEICQLLGQTKVKADVLTA